MSKEITPQMLWGAGIVLALILGFVFWKYVVAAPRSTAAAAAPTSASPRIEAIRAAREGRLHPPSANQKPATP